MKSAMKLAALIASVMVNFAHADSELKIQSDLMIHPDQLASFFDIATGNIGARSSWEWPAMTFSKPYKTSWTQVVAKGPFDVSFATADLKKQEVGFELNWAEPVVNVGRFEIHDTISRNVGGANIIINLDGSCSNMVVRMPAGGWKVKGTMKWNWTTQGLQVGWKDFQFSAASNAAAQVDLGQCDGANGLNQALHDAIETVSRDQAWMQDVLRDGVLDWVESSLMKLQVEMLKARDFELRPGLHMLWQPAELTDGGNGTMRVSGNMVFNKQSTTVYTETLSRSYDVPSLAGVKESGFVLPKSTLPTLVNFLFRTGDLTQRVASTQIESFTSLMQSRFMQFFVWPDLMSFPATTQFWFDVTSSQAPKLTNGRMLGQGGLQYDIAAPVLVRQWAPANNQYLQYADFRSPMNGTLTATVADGKVNLQLDPGQMDVSAQFRPEYAAYRQVNTWIATSLLGSRVSSYLQSTPFSMKVPEWAVAEGVNVALRDLQAWKYSFRIPLEFKKSK